MSELRMVFHMPLRHLTVLVLTQHVLAGHIYHCFYHPGFDSFLCLPIFFPSGPFFLILATILIAVVNSALRKTGRMQMSLCNMNCNRIHRKAYRGSGFIMVLVVLFGFLFGSGGIFL